jgi:hypothetical protein
VPDFHDAGRARAAKTALRTTERPLAAGRDRLGVTLPVLASGLAQGRAVAMGELRYRQPIGHDPVRRRLRSHLVSAHRADQL